MSDREQHAEEEPIVVYHYTSLKAMMEIVATREIWATNINYLNDVMERRVFLDEVEKQLPDFVKTMQMDSNEFPNEKLSLAFDQHYFGSVVGMPFVASFSSDADSLMHWRSYCPEANGVSIGFRTNCLRKSRCGMIEQPTSSKIFWSEVPAPRYEKVSYIESSSASIVQAAMDEAYRDTDSFIEEQNDIPEDERTSVSIENLFSLNIEAAASLYKHSSFMGENEYRLLISNVIFRQDVLKFRTSRSALVPYIALAIPSREKSEIPDNPTHIGPHDFYWDAIAEVVIGPSPNKDLTVEAVKAFFIAKDMEVEVRKSTVPYRDW